MRFSTFATLLAAATATTTPSALPTFTSTLISSTCSSSSSRTYYGNYTSMEVDSYIYETDYSTKHNTLTMLQTSCSNDECYVTTILNTLATVTATVDGILTTYITASPFTVIYNDHTTSTLATSEVHNSNTPASATVAKTSYFASETGSDIPASKVSLITSEGISTLWASETKSKTSKVAAETNVSSKNNYSGLTTASTTVSKFDGEETLGETVTIPHTTVLTITTCAHHRCQTTSITTGITTITSTVDGVKTVYTTYCPLSEEAKSTGVAAQSADAKTVHPTSGINAKNTLASVSTTLTSASATASSTVTSIHSTKNSADTETKTIRTKKSSTNSSVTTVHTTEPTSNVSMSTSTNVQTTVLTITSCSENRCSGTPVTTGVSYFTSTVSGTEIVFTTYCPLIDQKVSSAVVSTSTEISESKQTHTSDSRQTNTLTSISVAKSAGTSSSSKTLISSPGAESTVNVITNNILTQSKTLVTKSSVISSTGTSAVATALISSYQGGAAHAIPAVLALPVVYLLL